MVPPMGTKPNPALVNELWFALEVMEEYSHLGLDDESASKLREILLRHIDTLAPRSPTGLPIPSVFQPI